MEYEIRHIKDTGFYEIDFTISNDELLCDYNSLFNLIESPITIDDVCVGVIRSYKVLSKVVVIEGYLLHNDDKIIKVNPKFVCKIDNDNNYTPIGINLCE